MVKKDIYIYMLYETQKSILSQNSAENANFGMNIPVARPGKHEQNSRCDRVVEMRPIRSFVELAQ